ncbi:MAG: hypothetical protein WC719_01020 [Patescibacteria group bacterium]|jgi:hypothetical protein
MTEDAKQLKNTLESLITEFRKTYFKVIFSRKNIKLTETLSISDKLPELFTIIKKYLDIIESEKIFSGFMILLRKEVKDNDHDGALFGQNLGKIKNSKTKSYNWVYYSLFKEMIGGASLYAPAYQKSLKVGSLAPLKKALIENDYDGQVKEIKGMEEELKKFKLDIVLKPKLHKRFLLDFNKSVMSWLEASIMVGEFADTESKIYKEPITDSWESVEIRFKNNYDVTLVIDGQESDSSYDKLGFADTRQDSSQKATYIKSWNTLILFSTQNGRIKMNMYAGSKAKKDLFKKNKQDLSKRLKAHFGLKDDPIVYNEKNEEYQIKIKLVSPPEFRESWQDRHISESDSKKLPPKEYLPNY